MSYMRCHGAINDLIHLFQRFQQHAHTQQRFHLQAHPQRLIPINKWHNEWHVEVRVQTVDIFVKDRDNKHAFVLQIPI